MNVVLLKDSHDEAMWDYYVLNHPQASGYQTLAWRGIISKVFGHRTYYLMAKDEGGTVRGVLPLVLTMSPMFGCFLTSMAFFNYGGVLADRADARFALLAVAAETAKDVGAAHIELRQAEPHETDWPVRSRKVSMRLALPSDYETLMKAFPPKLRSQVRRGEKEGMTVHVGGLDMLDDYYQVFSRNMRDLGTPVYRKQFFAAILSAFPKDATIAVVKYEGTPVATGFLYGFRHTLEIPWASSDRRYARFAPNMFLYGAVLRYACEQGYRCFDFGRSSKESGTYRFKEQWGAKPVQLHWYYWLRDGGPLPELNPQNPKYALAIRLWQQLPVSVTTMVGPMIAKYLP